MHPYPSPPVPGHPIEVAPGILWLRIPLPIRLNHVNVYVFEDDGGWTIFDTGMADEGCREAWDKALAGALSGRPVKRIIGSHFHMDHVGLVGWFHDRFAPALYMSQTEYLLAHVFQTDGWREGRIDKTKFFQNFAFDVVLAEKIARNRLGMRSFQTPLPGTFNRLCASDSIRLGNRDWQVLTGAGHAVEQIMLYSLSDKIFLSADQVLPEISPNISVGALQPGADPLGDFLQSLKQIKGEVTDDVTVLPGHRMPFSGLHTRIDQLVSHHEARCAALIDGCRGAPLTGIELVPIVFERNFGPDVIGSAIGEAVAHANYLHRQGALEIERRVDGTLLYRTI